MRIIGTVLIFIMLFLFGSKVKLIDASSQEWAGGIYEAGYGTNFKITLLAKGNSEKLQVSDLWVGEEYYAVKAVKNLARRNDLEFDKKDTVYITAGFTFKPDKDERYIKNLGKQKPVPKAYDGVALLRYFWKGKEKYLEIDELKKLEKIIYP